MQAIETRYIPATNTKGARCKALAPGGTFVMVPWDSRGEAAEMHAAAAVALCERMGWGGTFVFGALQHSYVFVATTGANTTAPRMVDPFRNKVLARGKRPASARSRS